MDLFSFDVILKIIITLGLAFISNIFIKKSISFFFNSLKKGTLTSHSQRIDTLKSLVKNILTIVLYVIIFLMIFNDLGFNIVPILTGAGIMGVAISFGAQTLVKDFLSGFFIILENQYNVGNLIKIGDIEGEVVKLTLRTTILKDKKGNYIYISNSEIKNVIVYKQ